MKNDCAMNEKEKTGESMNHGKAEAIVARLLSNAAGLRYGSVSVTAKLHEGRVVGVTYSTTENTRESEAEEAGSVKAGCQV
jgi:hypothetical protein